MNKIFEQVKKFKAEQEKQKQRGLNNYNILTTVLKEDDEERLHSRMIASFLDPSGEHYQSTLFLDKFLEVLNIDEFNINTNDCAVYREYWDKDNGRIDLYITDGDKHIIIENKINARDQLKQIERYVEIIEKENKELKFNDILVIYLSLDKEKPTKPSLGDLTIDKNILKRNSKNIALFKSIHYKNEILEWLEKCQYEIHNITNLNEVFRQYIDVVKMINNQYKDKIMNLKDKLLKNEEWLELAKDISIAYKQAKEEILDNKKEKFIIAMENKLKELNKYEYEKLKWKAIDISNLNYWVRLIPQESYILVKITNQHNKFETIDKDEKNKILLKLQEINTNFISSDNKVYGALELKYNDIDKIDIDKIIKIIDDINEIGKK